MDDWYTAVCALPTMSDVSMMEINNMRKTVGYEFHYMWKKYWVPGMWVLRPCICLSSIWRQQGRDGTRMKSELMTIGMLGESGRRPGTFPSASSAWFHTEVYQWGRNPFVHVWPGPARRACYRGTVSWKSTRCINQQNEQEEARMNKRKQVEDAPPCT